MQSGLGRPAARADEPASGECPARAFIEGRRWPLASLASAARTAGRHVSRCGRLCALLLSFAAAGCANVGQIGNLDRGPPRFHCVRIGRRAAAGGFPQVCRAPSRRRPARAKSRWCATGQADYRLRGYLAAHAEGATTSIVWVWDVYGAGQRRAFRLSGEDKGARRRERLGGRRRPDIAPDRPDRHRADSPSSSPPPGRHPARPPRKRRLRRRNGLDLRMARRLDARGFRDLPHLPARAAARSHGRCQRRSAARRPGPVAERPAEFGRRALRRGLCLRARRLTATVRSPTWLKCRTMPPSYCRRVAALLSGRREGGADRPGERDGGRDETAGSQQRSDQARRRQLQSCARRRDRRLSRDPADQGGGAALRRHGNLRRDPGERARQRRFRDPVDIVSGQRPPDGIAHHHRRAAPRLRAPHHRGRSPISAMPGRTANPARARRSRPSSSPT